MFSRDLFEISNGNHIMLICENESERLDSAAHFINEGLERDQLCIFASVHAFDSESKLNVSSLSSKIRDCEMNIKEGNIQFVDFKPFYESAAASNISPFMTFKKKLETTLRDRIANGEKDSIMIYADAACTLTENKEFDESGQLETWWQNAHDEWTKNGNKITVICPHPAHVLNKELEVKWNIADAHDMMVYAKSHLVGISAEEKNNNYLRILIAESDPDILTLYSDYLSALGHDVSVVTDGKKCLSLFKKRDFDLIIVDTHLIGHPTVGNVTKEVMRIEPHQRILVTSTYPDSCVSKILGNFSRQTQKILQKPFELSDLVNVIKNYEYY